MSRKGSFTLGLGSNWFLLRVCPKKDTIPRSADYSIQHKIDRFSRFFKAKNYFLKQVLGNMSMFQKRLLVTWMFKIVSFIPSPESTKNIAGSSNFFVHLVAATFNPPNESWFFFQRCHFQAWQSKNWAQPNFFFWSQAPTKMLTWGKLPGFRIGLQRFFSKFLAFYNFWNFKWKCE